MIRKSFTAANVARMLRHHHRRAKLHRIVKANGLRRFGDDDPLRGELRARDLLHRAEQAAPWLTTPLYPAGGAAGPLLSYLILRALSELPFRSVLELGAGQSTRVISAWASSGERRTVTFEEDLWWADQVRANVNSANSVVIHLPLRDRPAPGGSVAWYSSPPPEVLPERGFDLVIVDGPVGSSRLSRYGIVEHIPEWVDQEWALMWDDLDRPADLESFALLIKRLRGSGLAHDHVLLDADRMVGVVFTPRYSALSYMW